MTEAEMWHLMLKDGRNTLVFCRSDELDRFREENARLRAAVERVRAVHIPVGYDVDLCWACRCDYPCPTLRALDGDA